MEILYMSLSITSQPMPKETMLTPPSSKVDAEKNSPSSKSSEQLAIDSRINHLFQKEHSLFSSSSSEPILLPTTSLSTPSLQSEKLPTFFNKYPQSSILQSFADFDEDYAILLKIEDESVEVILEEEGMEKENLEKTLEFIQRTSGFDKEFAIEEESIEELPKDCSDINESDNDEDVIPVFADFEDDECVTLINAIASYGFSKKMLENLSKNEFSANKNGVLRTSGELYHLALALYEQNRIPKHIIDQIKNKECEECTIALSKFSRQESEKLIEALTSDGSYSTSLIQDLSINEFSAKKNEVQRTRDELHHLALALYAQNRIPKRIMFSDMPLPSLSPPLFTRSRSMPKLENRILMELPTRKMKQFPKSKSTTYLHRTGIAKARL